MTAAAHARAAPVDGELAMTRVLADLGLPLRVSGPGTQRTFTLLLDPI
jgi:hypothetical protein